MPLNNKKTKIVCTIGPVSEKEEVMKELIKSGMNVMRLNFSHGDFAEHGARVKTARKISKDTGIPVAIIQDLCGPKIRIGDFKTKTIVLKEGAEFVITTEDIVGDEKKVHINYPLFPKEVKVGHFILLDDGKKKLEVVKIKGSDVVCKVIIGGEIKGRRGVNIPGADLSISSITEKDKKDLEFSLENEIDYVALSFIRRPEDIHELREILKSIGSKAGIIAKIETPQAVSNIDRIIEMSDAIMVARGDLAIEIPAENVPLIQKMIIKKCNQWAKPVITATQMLESMIDSPVPTRAEVSDIANAILDGTDAIMLSEETTLGKYPVEAVKVMTRVAKHTENDYIHKQLLSDHERGERRSVADSITASAVKTADRVGAKYIVSLTETGRSARRMSRHRPDHFIIVMTPNKFTFQKSILYFGCEPVHIKKFKTFLEALEVVREYCFKNKMAVVGDKIVIATGLPFDENTETNMLIVETL